MKKTLLFTSLIFFTALTFAQVRFVSKTGSSTPPYTSWATASDSIQKCINVCNDGDTVVVANEVYKESLVINAVITLLDSSMDSCIIDGTGLGGSSLIKFNNHGKLSGFDIKGKGINEENVNTVIANLEHNMNISQVKISNSNTGIFIGSSSGTIDGAILTNVGSGVETFCIYDTCKPKITNCLILTKKNNGGGDYGIYLNYGGQPVLTNNIIIALGFGYGGIDNGPLKKKIITNNLVAGFNGNINAGGVKDTAFIVNNICSDYKIGFTPYASIKGVSNKTVLLNNIVVNNDIGVEVFATPIKSDYNLYWNNKVNTTNGLVLGVSDVFANPMFVEDTVASSLTYDFHLQKYSPAIDAGDPTILDKDGSRSDIGMYGGPLGESYTYQDLAPKPPRNLIASVNNGNITLKWLENTESDFSYYKVYRDVSADFIYDSTKNIALTSDTTYTEPIPQEGKTIYYKVTAWDSAKHQSPSSEEISVNLTNLESPQLIANDYKLFQNYPNPFNPSTMISYRLKERGYVKLVVHDIKGELVKILVNQEQEAGYYEETFSANGLTQLDLGSNNFASGIYLFSLTIIGERGIPVFTDMKKSILLK